MHANTARRGNSVQNISHTTTSSINGPPSHFAPHAPSSCLPLSWLHPPPPQADLTGSRRMQQTKGLVDPATGTISMSDLQRMRMTASGEFERQQQEAQREQMAAKMEATMKAQERKERMRRLEAERKMSVPPTALEAEKTQAKARVLTEAEKKLSEELDDVKRMNQMCLYAKVVTIRDAQVNEKKIIEKERQEEERRLDTIMEIERLKALKMYEERERRRAEANRLGSMVIIDQIKERERERARRLEMQDQEREAMIRQHEQMKAEELKQQIARKKVGEQLLRETALSNASQIILKQQAAQNEKEENARIQAYIRAKEKREQEQLLEQQRLKAERERETARLRAKQEKMKDKQAELDALRAKRAMEEAERAWRKKERDVVTKQLEMNAALAAAREAQKLEKERRMIELAQQEREDFGRILRVQSEADSDDRMRRTRQLEVLSQHQDDLKVQIKMNAERRKKNRLDFLTEGEETRAQMDADRIKLESIKAEKLEALHRAGVPSKYTVDLQSKRFT
mmetsp:Transcript_15678/g.42993  ORF Transcript_15678/g.42993 Transcript_15678/m.42993 type:complete len:514 (+) Transcript_15678:255-1796(+)